MDIDWLKASEDQRKQLYVATRSVADASDTTVEAIMDAALGRKALMGTDYMSTFRRGKIRRSYAKLIHGWIANHHPELGHQFAADLFPQPNTDAWGQFLDEHAVRGQLRSVKFKPSSLGLVERARQTVKPDDTLRLGEKFCLQIECKGGRYAQAYQIYKGQWHPIPLCDDGSMTARIAEGDGLLPIQFDGTPDPLVEQRDTGPHQFVVITSQTGDDLPDLDTIPTPSETVEWHVISVHVASA
ncbi:hypothetical protein KMP13_08995 [Epibacterium ulvae]|uniref:hypothetical protein n=1 Tax=Epibacterium ulvae TaxID=1156985 RepID=UPI001BFC9CEE|nr:hypothetical protein [Epibacterium ulvae]MBT8154033.1 hypothetical protein [Epibacterium ulvae]